MNMSIVRTILRNALPLVVLALGFGVFRYLVSTRPEAPRAPRSESAAVVHTEPITVREAPLRIVGHGTVAPAREVVLQAELTARVRARHPNLIPGGIVERGATLVRLDGRDFRAAIAQQTAQLETQRLQVQTEEQRRAIAERELAVLGTEASPEGRALALREPHLRSVRALEAATSVQLDQARTILTRTSVRAPFRALVREADVEVGQLVGPAARLAVLVDTSAFWVQASVPLASLADRLRMTPSGPTIEADAMVRVTIGESTIEKPGRVVRILGDLDPMGRMARVLIEVPDPLGLEGEGSLPILLGSYAEVAIEAGVLAEAVTIPRSALREDDTVWLLVDGHLAIRSVQIASRGDESVVLRGGVQAGERLITSVLSRPVVGMALRDEANAPGAP